MDDVPDGKHIITNGWPWDAFVVSRNFSVKVAPGYDVARSFDKTIFIKQGIQKLTVTFIPRDKLIDKVTVYVHTDEDEFVNPVVLSYSSTETGEVKIEQDGHRSSINSVPVKPGIPLTVTVNIQVTPKVPLIQYKPYTGIQIERVSVPEEGVATGSSVFYTTEMGTWTWSADGNYVWRWGVRSADNVGLTFHRSSSPISIWIVLILVVMGATALGIILYKRKRLKKSSG